MRTQPSDSDPLASDNEPLAVTSILVESLPRALLTDAAPQRYVVEAVFSRRVEPQEADLILGRETQEFLDAAGYPSVQLSVSDRRLVIANTNLQELRDGLAEVIATLLASISSQVRRLQQQQDARQQEEATRLQERTRAIVELTDSIDFVPSTELLGDLALEKDRAATERWDSEGGSIA